MPGITPKINVASAEILNRIDSVRNDFTNGSGVIARNAIQILRDAAQSTSGSESKYFLKSIAQKLLEAKPGMAATVNFMKICLREIENFTTADLFLQYLAQLESRIEKSSDTCVDSALRELPLEDGTSMVTCSFSSVVFKIIGQTKKKIKVWPLQSKWKDYDYGMIFNERLRDAGIASEYLPFTDLHDKKFDFALVGADAILRNGSVINGKPSLYLAERLKLKDIPFFVAGESFKRCNKISLGDGFDLIPKKLIKKILSDNAF